MNFSPRFSVIIPTFNCSETISRAVDSVLKQSWPAYEIIVVDDGSIDDTRDVVSKMQGKISYIFQENSGVSAARNTGAQAASGDWLAFLDADDIYYADRLKWHADMINSQVSFDFLTGDFEYRGPDGALLRRSMESSGIGRKLLEKNKGKVTLTMEKECFPIFIEEHFGDTHTISIPKSTFCALGGYSTNFQVCEDVHMLIRLCDRSSRAGVVTKPMAVYNIHNQSLTRSDPIRAQKQTVEALNSLKGRLRTKGMERGLDQSIRRARLDLAYAYLKSESKTKAILAVLPLLIEQPKLLSLKDLLSIIKG
ncbi:glycosyltransferase family 2 protein [Desulfospira joergensenii]|uniref:glycosyltransferase family 2 protein n=1 Tax=Desulfospira joergensenii TaxID=53329 RepID=UPI0003B3D745|nr:glycosyltransferase [Desulfospira joergensenii]